MSTPSRIVTKDLNSTNPEFNKKKDFTSKKQEIITTSGLHNVKASKEGENNNNNNKHSPVLILHVGPTKTGTSSIQCALQTSPFLNKSSYEYIDKYQTGCNPGKYPLTNKRLPNHAAVMQLIVFQRSNKSADLLKKSLKRSYSNNHNAIISAEELDAMEYKSEKTWDFLNEALLQPYLYEKRNTHVVVTYRHLHERFLSSYYENVVTRKIKDRWGNKIAVPFPEHFSTMIGDEEYYDRQLNLGRLIDAYERHSFNVTIFNFHGDDDSDEEEDVVTRFLCQLPRAAATCEAYKNDLKNDANNNRSSGNRSRSSMKSYSQYDRIAKTAYNMKLFKQFNMTDINRLEVVQAIEYRMNSLGMKSYTDLPLDCVGDEELNTLLEMSIQNGRRVFKGRRTSTGTETGTGITTYRQDDIIRTSFEAYKKRQEFCSVDVDSLLKERSWTHFFKHELKATVLSIRDQSRMQEVMN